MVILVLPSFNDWARYILKRQEEKIDSLKKQVAILEKSNHKLTKLNQQYNTIQQYSLPEGRKLMTEYLPLALQLLLFFCTLIAIAYAFYQALLQKGILKKETKPIKEQETTKPQKVSEQNEAASSSNIPKTTTSHKEIPMSNSRYFFGEVMVTAGPRKQFTTSPAEADIGLGEDVAGFICLKDRIYFWVLDGTSDSDKIDMPHPVNNQKLLSFFSSRLLAQSIGWHIQKVISKQASTSLSAKFVLENAIKQTLENWRGRLNALSTDNKNQLKTVLLDRKNLQCSTTAILGILTIEGDLDICQIGDSKVVTHPTSKQTLMSKGRQFIALGLNELKDIKLSINDFDNTNYQENQSTGIRTVFAMTDGVSVHTEKWLSNFDEFDFSNPSIREKLANQPGTTQDDKAICIIQIREEEINNPTS